VPDAALLIEVGSGLVLCFPHRSTKIEVLPAKPSLAGNGGGWIVALPVSSEFPLTKPSETG